MPQDITTTSISEFCSQYIHAPTESNVKHEALQCLVSILRSLATWANKSTESTHSEPETPNSTAIEDGVEPTSTGVSKEKRTRTNTPTVQISNNIDDDPEAFEQLRHKKQVLIDCIRRFNWNHKKVPNAVDPMCKILMNNRASKHLWKVV
jgi:brefeldin A-inhibited guanine nucleotide-exchange protein